MALRRILLVLLSLLLLTGIALAHGGRTDSNGGHWDHSTGEYHYHNDGSYQGGSSSGSSSSGGSSSKPSTLITTSSVNMREGAGTSYSIIATLPKGTTVSYGGKVSGNWYYIKYNGRYGWIHMNYARVSSWESSSGASSTSKTQSSSGVTFFDKSPDELRALIESKSPAATQALQKQRKGEVPSMKTLILVFCAGLLLGIVVTVLLTKRRISSIRADSMTEIQNIKSETAKQIAVTKSDAEAFVRDAQSAADQQVVNVEHNLNLKLLRLSEQHAADIASQRKLQEKLFQTQQTISALKTVAKPDVANGVVYISSLLESEGKYHHWAACPDLEFGIKVSKKSASALDYTPCKCTYSKHEPEADATVYITSHNQYCLAENLSSFRSAYHKEWCPHISNSKVSMKLSKLDSWRFYPCSTCKPPKKNQTIWI